MKAFSYAFICTLMLSGCAVEMPETLERKHQDLIPTQWTSGEGKEAASIVREKPQQWWARWNNETLSFLVEKTLLNNTDIAQAQANLRSAQASLTKANSSLWPSFDIGADATDQWKNHDWTQGYSAEAASSWSFSFGGRDLATQGAASATTKAQALTLEDTQSAVASEVVKTYIALCQANEQLAILEKNVLSYEEGRNLAQWRHQAGLVSAIDAEQASASYESMRAQIATARHSIHVYQTALSRLTVLPLVTIKGLPAKGIPQAPDDLAVAIPADVISLRPDVQAARASVIAALYKVRAAQADFFPTLSLSGSIGTTAATVSALGASGTGIGALVGALSMPILNWGEAIAGTETQKAALDTAQAKYTAALVGALEETENALSQLRTTQSRQKSLLSAQKSSELAAQLALQQYSNGLVDYETVLSTLRSQLSAQEAVVNNQSEQAQAYVELYRALGGGWTPEGKDKEEKNG